MRRLFLVWVGILLLAVPALAQYVIEDYRVDLKVQADGLVRVQEDLRVRFDQPRRGIIRSIPWALDDGKGTARAIFLHFDGVTVDGGPTVYKESRGGSKWTLKIGDPDITFAPGTRKLYTIRYSVENVFNWHEETSDWQPTAELYWNAVGTEWTAPIDKIGVTLSFPQTKSGVRMRAFAGGYGSRNQATISTVGALQQGPFRLNLGSSSATIDYGVTSNPGEGLTMVLALPADAIAKPSTAQQIRYTVLPNLGFAIPLLALIGAVFAYFKFGKDPARGPMVVQYEPPDGMSGSELGVILDERVDSRDIAAGIISLAVHGHLTLSPHEEGLIFKRKTARIHLTGQANQDGLTEFELMLLGLLRNCGEPIDDLALRTHVAPSIGLLRSSLYDAMVKRGYYRSSPESARNSFIGCGVVLLAILGFLAFIISPTRSPLPSIVGGVIGLLILLPFAKLMPRRTSLGAKTFDLARGFEDFIRRAKGQEIEHFAKNRPIGDIFEEYLPHAIALGLAKEWSMAFEGLLHEMPSWYDVPYGTPYSYMYFSNDLVSMSDTLSQAASTPPRSDGASGGGSGFSDSGGFSGGGFGGGGGDSW
ncbi:MAG: DUF2207 domain-containing protein [Fimbriimonas sp.]